MVGILSAIPDHCGLGLGRAIYSKIPRLKLVATSASITTNIGIEDGRHIPEVIIDYLASTPVGSTSVNQFATYIDINPTQNWEFHDRTKKYAR